LDYGEKIWGIADSGATRLALCSIREDWMIGWGGFRVGVGVWGLGFGVGVGGWYVWYV